MKRFYMYRKTDESGVSGTGMVVEGVLLSNTKCIASWRTVHKSVAVYDSLAEMEAIHGHDGSTVMIWVDEEPCTPETVEAKVKALTDPPKKKKTSK